jgi:LPXTG-site transpeptidase (sortase) family protein
VNRIIIPALALDTVVKYVPYDGLTWLIAGLNQEIAWMGDTSWPGLGGNTALAGHVTLRDGSNGPFRYLADLRYGDAIFVYTEKNIYEYMVSEQVNVEATDLAVLGASQESQITLITCSDWDMYTGFYTKRLVVKANLVGAKLVQQQTRGN